jgi:hypothetical protein
MTLGRLLFQEWASPGDPWSPWVKPTLFAQITAPAPTPLVTLPDTNWSRASSGETAIVVELPGIESLAAGFSLALNGYRPVPLYNTSHGDPQPVVDVAPLLQAISSPLPVEVRTAIAGGGPPAFLIDSNRNRQCRLEPGTYDNRWVVFPQDFPSANFLRARGIRRVIVLHGVETPQPQEDLVHVLLRWQEEGLAILLHKSGDSFSPKEIRIAPPSRFRALRYRVLVMMGLRRNSAGGFGSVVPSPSAGTG